MNSVDWIPVDILASIIVELAGAADIPAHTNGAVKQRMNGLSELEVEPAGTVPVFHAINPEVSEWADLLPAVREYLGEKGLLDLLFTCSSVYSLPSHLTMVAVLTSILQRSSML